MRPVLSQGGARKTPERVRAARASAGFTLVEVLIAALLVLVVALGISTLFLQATRSNLAGNDSTRVANFAKSRVEELMQLPIDSDLLEIQAGTERRFDEYYRMATGGKTEGWIDGTLGDAAGAGDTALWSRTTVIRQFAVEDLTTPLDDSALPTDVDIKEIVVTVASTRDASGPLGAGKSLSVRAMKSE